jgi:integrase
VLSPRTEKDYREVVARWTRDGRPDPGTWVAERSSEATRRNARAALIWQFRVNLGETLAIPWVRPLQRPVPSAFSVEELAVVREAALGAHPRCRPVIDLLYSTGARLQEACGISLEDVTESHIILPATKRRPGGLQVHRAVPLGPLSRAAVYEVPTLATPCPALRAPRQECCRTCQGRSRGRETAISSGCASLRDAHGGFPPTRILAPKSGVRRQRHYTVTR